MFDEDVKTLTNMVVNLKVIESGDNFKEILDNLDKDNEYYDEIVKANENMLKLKEHYRDFEEKYYLSSVRSHIIFDMERKILDFLKGRI